MEKDHIDIVELELLQTLGERGLGVFVALVGIPDLGGDPELVARDTGKLDGITNLLLVAVELGGIKVAVAMLESIHKRVGAMCEIHTETKLRDACAVVEGDCRDGRHFVRAQRGDDAARDHDS